MFREKLIIPIVLIFICGCAGTKNAPDTGEYQTGRNAAEVVRNTVGKNLTGGGFFINKARIVTSGESGKIALYFSMKFMPPDKYLISIRSRTGKEAFRVYMSQDTVLINDRLNQNVLFGNIRDFEKIAGIPAPLLKVSIGDLFVLDPKLQPDEKCIENEVKLSEYFLGLMIKSTIDCRKNKVKAVSLTTGVPDEFITIEYKKHREDYHSLPRKVEINDFRRKIQISLFLDRYTAPWIGDIEFFPGNGYTLKPLL